MYHDYISRKSKPIKTNYNFVEDKEILFDISDNFVDEFKEVMIKEKSKTILELLKNKNVIYEKNV